MNNVVLVDKLFGMYQVFENIVVNVDSVVEDPLLDWMWSKMKHLTIVDDWK